MATPVIDMWAPVLPVPEIMAHIAENFPDAMLGYLRVFWKQRPSQQALRAGAPALARPLSEVVAALDAAHHAHAHHRLRRAVHRRGDLHPERAGRTDRRAPPGSLHSVRGRGHHEGPHGAPRARALGTRARLPWALAAALHDRAARRRPALLPLLREVRGARH